MLCIVHFHLKWFISKICFYYFCGQWSNNNVDMGNQYKTADYQSNKKAKPF